MVQVDVTWNVMGFPCRNLNEKYIRNMHGIAI